MQSADDLDPNESPTPARPERAPRPTSRISLSAQPIDPDTSLFASPRHSCCSRPCAAHQSDMGLREDSVDSFFDDDDGDDGPPLASKSNTRPLTEDTAGDGNTGRRPDSSPAKGKAPSVKAASASFDEADIDDILSDDDDEPSKDTGKSGARGSKSVACKNGTCHAASWGESGAPEQPPIRVCGTRKQCS